MRRTYIGEFEELVLLVVGILDDNAYGVSVKEEITTQTGRAVNISAVHAALKRLEQKGYLNSRMGGAEAVRGGRRKRLYQLTMRGKAELAEIREVRERLWAQIPKVSLS
jgi:PadR family transcriptional regulator PadR